MVVRFILVVVVFSFVLVVWMFGWFCSRFDGMMMGICLGRCRLVSVRLVGGWLGVWLISIVSVWWVELCCWCSVGRFVVNVLVFCWVFSVLLCEVELSVWWCLVLCVWLFVSVMSCLVVLICVLSIDMVIDVVMMFVVSVCCVDLSWNVLMLMCFVSVWFVKCDMLNRLIV